MTILKAESWHYITGRGKVAVVDLNKNGISRERKGFNQTLFGQDVEIDGKKYNVIGIEAFATGEHYLHNMIGVLVKEII